MTRQRISRPARRRSTVEGLFETKGEPRTARDHRQGERAAAQQGARDDAAEATEKKRRELESQIEGLLSERSEDFVIRFLQTGGE